MGVYIADSDSESLDEKGQTQTTHERSHCPLNLIAHLRKYRERRERKYRPRINEIRRQITQDYEKSTVAWNGPWKGTTSTAQRHALWESGLCSHSLAHYGRKYSTSRRYKVIMSNPRTGSDIVVVHDFRTPEGREEAFKWWNTMYKRNETVAADFSAFHDIFQEYVKHHHSFQREVLLLAGNLKIDWCKHKVQELPN